MRCGGENKDVAGFLVYIFLNVLKLLHPFIPFITEKIYGFLPDKMKVSGYLIISEWPVYDENLVCVDIYPEIDLIMKVVNTIRSMRSNFNVPPGKNINIKLKGGGEVERKIKILEKFSEYIIPLINAANIELVDKFEKQKGYASDVIEEVYIYVELKGLIDQEKERERLNKKISELDKNISNFDKKLNNEQFLHNAPENIVEDTRQLKAKLEEEFKKKQDILNQI
jgi:valyl-tRNA synthetase